jgi:hypothetical protein
MKLRVFQADKEDVFQDMVHVDQSCRPRISAGQIFRVTANGITVLAVARGPRNNKAQDH